MNEELKVLITAEVNKFKSNIDKANKEIEKFSKDTNKHSESVKKAMDKIGNAAKNAGKKLGDAFKKGMKLAVGAIAGLATASVKMYADYEQLVGGVETLFGKSSNVVQKYASEAYKTAGLSANKYMEVTTSFSASLLQSVGGDTAKAAEYANGAIVDMSDNANKMGTSMEAIQNAYQGFAKQNYTMLDNLKLGYGGTKGEMERLIADANKVKAANGEMANLSIDSFADVTEAIHIIQTEMGVTGTTAKEASSTISGSIGMVKASFQNLMVGISDENANFQELLNQFVESVGVAFENLMPRIQVAIGGVANLIGAILPLIIEQIPVLIETLVPALIEMLNSIVTTLGEQLPVMLQSLITSVQEFLPNFITIMADLAIMLVENLPILLTALMTISTTILQSLATEAPKIVQEVAKVIPEIVNSFINGLPALLQASIDLLMALVDAIPVVIPMLIDALPEIIDNLCNFWLENYPLMLEAANQLFNALIDAIPVILDSLVPALPQIIDTLVNTLIQGVPMMLKGAIQIFMAIVKAIPQVLPKIISAVGTIVKTVKDNLVDKLKNALKFEWSLPKVKLPHFSVSPAGWKVGDLLKGTIPKLGISWYARGGVFEKPTLFNQGNGNIGGLGEAGAEAIVPLENNTKWLDKIAEKLAGESAGTPIVLEVDGKIFAQTAVNTINNLTRQNGKLSLQLI